MKIFGKLILSIQLNYSSGEQFYSQNNGVQGEQRRNMWEKIAAALAVAFNKYILGNHLRNVWYKTKVYVQLYSSLIHKYAWNTF